MNLVQNQRGAFSKESEQPLRKGHPFFTARGGHHMRPDFDGDRRSIPIYVEERRGQLLRLQECIQFFQPENSIVVRAGGSVEVEILAGPIPLEKDVHGDRRQKMSKAAAHLATSPSTNRTSS